ncbi:MAG: hypothetical protein OEY20_00335 [Gemmatimonadota bacterium]|nr:hypothetical protein [Gemmatimonadota bacterium]MDH5195680.1 hypothetical protein [Gemmatimonadota bacterium]
MTATTALEHCAVCGAAEPFGLGLCPGCGGAPPAAGDTLIFVQPTEPGSDRHRVLAALQPLLTGRAHASDQRLVAAGHRALLRVPAGARHAVLNHLSAQGIPAEAQSTTRAWATVPRSFVLLLAGIVLAGLLAGAQSEPMLRWMSPVYAVLLLLAAQLRLRRPAVHTDRKTTFPVPVERALAEAFAHLPDGTARDLLVRLIHAAEPLHRTLTRQAVAARRRDVEDLLLLASRAAQDLDDIERGLDAVGDTAQTDRAGALRDGLLARFRDGIAVLHQLRAESVDDEPAHDALNRLVVALDEDAEAYAVARTELALLLGAT